LKNILLFIIIVSVQTSAQISVDAISTDTVDIFNTKNIASGQVPQGISWLSFILPGSGHQYIGRFNKALGFISLDIFAITGAVFFRNYSKQLTKNYKAFATQYADVTASAKDDFFWQTIGNYDNYADYDQTLALVREDENSFGNKDYLWRWQDGDFRKEYVNLQKKAKKFTTISSFFIGTLVLNRIISFIDIRSTLKNSRFKNDTFSFKPVRLGPSANGVVLETTF
jgi:hypothetical protein